uniref:Uncharacterized protein n=1 Tax=Candidatus Kentrum sp. SD TaxID=2126332 RepID=A0A451BHV9_9GAMM|nr:MAG: hypothetical protein BECKSD772D_GA0070982_100337 [Candidatus Kentron sp. SD]
MQSAKQAAKAISDYLPEQASWDDILYELYVKQKIEEGLADVEAAPSPTNRSRPSCRAMATTSEAPPRANEP